MVTQMGRDVDGDGDRLEELYVRFAPSGIRLAYLMTGSKRRSSGSSGGSTPSAIPTPSRRTCAGP